MISGLLSNQIAYNTSEAVNLLFRSSTNTHLNSGITINVTSLDSGAMKMAHWKYWGKLWGEHWWIAEIGYLHEGTYHVATVDARGSEWTQKLLVRDKPYWDLSLKHVALGQLERRSKIPTVSGQGWLDCGAHLSEANSNAVALFGLANLWLQRKEEIDTESRERLLRQISVGCRYLLFLAAEAKRHGLPSGTFIHEPVYSHNWLLSDGLQVGIGLLSAANILAGNNRNNQSLVAEIIDCVKATYQYYSSHFEMLPRLMGNNLPGIEDNEFIDLKHFSRHAHAIDHDLEMPMEWATRDLHLWLYFLLLLDPWLDQDLLQEATEIASRISDRFVQLDNRENPSDPDCYFIPYPGIDQPEVAWCHHSVGIDTGGVFPHFLIPLWELAKRCPDHPEAGKWKSIIQRFIQGYLAPAFAASPFGLLPNTWKNGKGWLFFAGLWHGMNASYALMAMQCFYFARELNEPWLVKMAEAQLHWIAGLNCGLTRESLYGCDMCHRDMPDNLAEPVSMIFGEGRNYFGSYRTIRGSISNGFSRGGQFKFDVEPDIDEDRPDAFTDEDWITHAGAWLSAISQCNL